MKASELRIGNLSSNGVVNSISRNLIQIKDDHENLHYDFDPITLTEEWLLKFGFVKRGLYYHFPNHDIFKLDQYKNKNAWWLRHRTEEIDCTKIKYVHQLQNLYFALTGEELTIKQDGH